MNINKKKLYNHFIRNFKLKKLFKKQIKKILIYLLL